jgi:formylglycine-generating enzyme required for sulfatase activity
MAHVGRFCIDQWEDALEEEGPDGRFTPHPYFERPPSDKRYRAVTASGQFPQGYISRVEAKAACEASHKRLCTKREWQRACRGKGFQRYPYGERGAHDKCNSNKLHLLTQMFKNPMGGMKYEEHFNSPELNKTPGFLAKTGEYAECKTELDVYDMVGNLHEWVSDTVDQDLVDKMEEDDVERHKQPWREGNGVFMGGFYSTGTQHGPGCLFITIAHEPSYHDYSTGFRCCDDAVLPPKPASAKPTKPAKPAGPKPVAR